MLLFLLGEKKEDGQADKQTNRQTDEQTSRQTDRQTRERTALWERVRFLRFVVFVVSSFRRFVVLSFCRNCRFRRFRRFRRKKTQNYLFKDQIFSIFVKRIFYGQQQDIEDKLEHQLPKVAMLQEECNNLRPNIPLLHTLYQPQR